MICEAENDTVITVLECFQCMCVTQRCDVDDLLDLLAVVDKLHDETMHCHALFVRRHAVFHRPQRFGSRMTGE